MSYPRVPVSVEGLTALRARYPAAVADVVDELAVSRGLRAAPSSDPRHVFDTPDGWRLIVSLDRLPDGRVGTHLSVSIREDAVTHIHARYRSGDAMADAVLRAWRFIAQSTQTPELMFVTDGGIPHWFLERGN